MNTAERFTLENSILDVCRALVAANDEIDTLRTKLRHAEDERLAAARGCVNLARQIGVLEKRLDDLTEEANFYRDRG